MKAYEFYWRDTDGQIHLIGILPERRQAPERMTERSILNWGLLALPDGVDPERLFFVEIFV